jgi:hypothetical protein
LARRKSNAIYNIIPKSWEWLTINYAINVVGGVLLSFYIFKGERLKDDYIKLYKPSIYMVMQKKHG